ncbi:MAG: hypothetical protein MUP63_00740 [Candidatus Nanohaloarchaeota archaeon QJJ-7]|nr:hypothetical protein [Candidatus Nanohaloarchaeota archaeon QJJ-7]
MRSRILALLTAVVILSAFVGAVSYDNSTTQEVVQNIEEYSEVYNKNIESVPSPLKRLVSGERINLYIETDEGNRSLGAVMDDAKVDRLEEGGLESPSLEIYTGINTTEKILGSSNVSQTALDAYNAGEIRYRTDELGTRIKMALVTFFSGVFGFLL